MTLFRIIVGVLGIAYIIIGFIGTVICSKTKRRTGELLRTFVLIGLTYYIWFK